MTSVSSSICILCCVCGTPIAPNPANTCSSCLASKADVTRGIQTEVTLHQCRGCQRWHLEAGKWIGCELESRELMSLCLSNISGLHHRNKKSKEGHSDRVRLVDAAWVWTEPHSMRLKVRLTVQKQVQTGTILQQSFNVIFIVRNQQCVECQSEFRTGSWKTVIQVRQRVKHKRTFLYLEQLILKHGAHKGCLSIETFKDGMDFYFAERNKAAKFQSFLENVVPMQVKCSKKLIGMDDRNNVANYKYTHFVEIVPLCKDDLLYLPSSLAKSLGNISRLVLVKNISELIHVIDPLTCQTAQFSADIYWRHESTGDLRPIITASRSRFTNFIILGKDAVVQESTITDDRMIIHNNSVSTFSSSSSSSKKKRRIVQMYHHRRNKLAALTVSREEDLGKNDQQFETVSHMGYLMKSGDTAIGYDLTNLQFVNDEAENARSSGLLPSIVILRKLYSATKSTRTDNNDDDDHAEQMKSNNKTTTKKQSRMFCLQKLDVDIMDGVDNNNNTTTKNKKKKKSLKMNRMEVEEDEDEEDFLRQVEADKEMRANINLYKSKLAHVKDQDDENDENDKEGDDDDDDDQKVRLEELLDGLVLGDDEEDDKNEKMSMTGEDDETINDVVTYVGREDARRIQDKEMAHAVSEFGKEYM